jgi:flagellar FliL protein
MAKLKMILPLLLVLGGVYKFVIAKPAAEAAKPKIAGQVYVMPKDFLVNLQGSHFAKLGVALVFKEGFLPAGEAAGGHEAAAAPPDGYGVLTQEAVVRSIVTDVLTDQEPKELASAKGREALQEKILKRIHKTTDVEADEVLFTDISVQ